jgi:hypothetical protein
VSKRSAQGPEELNFLLAPDGSLIVYQQKDASWVSLPVFSSEEKAREFVRASKLEVADIASLRCDDTGSISELVRSVKKRAVRNLLLDLDYRTGKCVIIEFLGDGLGPRRQWQFTPATKTG